MKDGQGYYKILKVFTVAEAQDMEKEYLGIAMSEEDDIIATTPVPRMVVINDIAVNNGYDVFVYIKTRTPSKYFMKEQQQQLALPPK